ncbi:hypothetical protein C8A01DRAFT_15106 [Parachaetomium inaequale]|uniref:DUF7730 domain-containing protein n=1 Tax=Parachaetomium inaequale TaxID=2588326 RepID=A0AAN6SSN9_9PEZI|nr:hypothetical protein C8A01DRAFT_15106 [Parachaetomium inaequale]
MDTPFKRWLKQRFQSSKEATTNHYEDHDAPPEPPPYRANCANMPASTADIRIMYGPFQHLPLEIRQQILGHAFGNRTLHLDLTFEHPLTRKPSRREKTNKSTRFSAHPRPTASRTHCGLGTDLVRDASEPKQWQWFSCVCHRRLVRAHEDGGSSVPKARIEPCEDGCIPREPIVKRVASSTPSMSLCHCESAGTFSADECFIGVIGWLLACRQAYLDGTAVLYGTNSFHISSLPLLLNLPRLLPPQHLAAITSLELLWTFTEPALLNDETMNAVWAHAQPEREAAPSSTDQQTDQPTKFHRLCDLIPTTFPNLRRLYVALQAYIPPPSTFPSSDVITDVDRLVLAPVEDMFRRLGPTQDKEFALAIQRGGWQVFADRLRQRDPHRAERVFQVLDGGKSYREGIWRPLVKGVDGAGYWLRQGWDDFEVFGAEYWMFDLWRTGDYRGEAL